MIYVASPYSHSAPSVQEARYIAVRSYTHQLILAGLYPFSPIVYAHSMAEAHNLPQDHEFWLRFDSHFFHKCDSIHVLKLQGWQDSRGVINEIDWAIKAAMPITYIEGKPYENI